MSDQPDDPSAAPEQATEQATAWPEAAEAPAWSQIVDQPEPAAPGSAEPGAAGEQAPTEAQPSSETGRSRRPTSLRDQSVQDSDGVPRRKLSAPAFSSAGAEPGSPLTPPVSDSFQAGNPGQVPPASSSSRLPNPASLLGKLPTDRISIDSLPLDRLSSDRLSLDRLRSLTKQRPEVGLGLAFAGGLVLATILKRLGRR